jgi:hypothetical protein
LITKRREEGACIHAGSLIDEGETSTGMQLHQCPSWRLTTALNETRTATGQVAAADEAMEITRALTGCQQDFEAATNSGARRDKNADTTA